MFSTYLTFFRRTDKFLAVLKLFINYMFQNNKSFFVY